MDVSTTMSNINKRLCQKGTAFRYIGEGNDLLMILMGHDDGFVIFY